RRQLDPLVGDVPDRNANETRLVARRAAEHDSGARRSRARELLERWRRDRQQPGVYAAVRTGSGGRFRQLEVIVFINIIGQGAPPLGVYSECSRSATCAAATRGGARPMDGHSTR